MALLAQPYLMQRATLGLSRIGWIRYMHCRWAMWIICFGFAQCAYAELLRVKVIDDAARSEVSSYLNKMNAYRWELLKLAIAKSGEMVVLEHTPTATMEQNRVIEYVASGKLDLLWTMTSIERERNLLPIRIPIYKGLVGWRIAFIRPDSQQQFSQIHSLKDLQQYSAGQGSGWPDNDILRANNIKVQEGSDWTGRFKMLSLGRFDFYPRSILEILDEKDFAAKHDVIIENSMVIHYPAATYFFVAKHNDKLARIIEKGLNKAIKDGAFDQLFNQYHSEKIALLKLYQRRVIQLNNPILPPQTPLSRGELWFDMYGRVSEKHD